MTKIDRRKYNKPKPFVESQIQMTQTLLKFFPKEVGEDIQKNTQKWARFKHNLIYLEPGEYRIMRDSTGKYPPYKIDYTNFITCLECEQKGLPCDFFVSLKSYRHHWRKMHGEYTERKGEDLLQKYILNKELVTCPLY